MPRFNTFKAAGISIVLAVFVSLAGSAPNMLRYKIQDNGMVSHATNLPPSRVCLDGFSTNYCMAIE